MPPIPNIDLSRFNLWRYIRPRLPWRLRLHSHTLYMIRPGERCADDDAVAVERRTYEPASIEEIYTDLLSLHERQYNDELINELAASNLTLTRAYVNADDVAKIYLTGDLVVSGECAASRLKPQLERPAHQVYSGTGTVRATDVYINDQPLEELL